MENIKKELCQMIIERLNLDDVTSEEIEYDEPLFLGEDYDEDGEFIGLGLDSVDALELVVGIRETYGIIIEDTEMAIFYSINTLASFIADKKEEKVLVGVPDGNSE